MSRSRILLSASLLLFGVGLVTADEPKNDPPVNPRAARKAKMKAEAEARVKAEAEAKAKEEAAAKAEAEAKAKVSAVSKSKLDHASLTKRIDEEIGKKLSSEKAPASRAADDAEFLRRVYLGLPGVIPPAAKSAEFIDSKDPQKRAKLIDELLAGPGFGRRQADLWDNLLFQRISENRAIQRDPLTKWLEQKFNDNVGWDIVVSELLTATGTQEENGAPTFFLAALPPDNMVDSLNPAFLGIKMECP